MFKILFPNKVLLEASYFKYFWLWYWIY